MTISSDLLEIDGVMRVETQSLEELQFKTMELTHTVYPHDELYGEFCAIQSYIAVPPKDLFHYMKHIESLNEWTYSTRFYTPPNENGVYKGVDAVGGKDTPIYGKVIANEEAMTVDYHCAWDQGDELWMIYLNRIVDAQAVLGKPGSVVFWQNCHHKNYDTNPYPHLGPQDRPWVGEYWDFFYAGHTIELQNLKAIVEHRYNKGESLISETLLIQGEA